MNTNQILKASIPSWNEYSNESEVWIYQCDRILQLEEINEIMVLAHKFVGKWHSHGVKVNGDFQLIHQRFLVFLAAKDNSPSGCSKDSMVHFIEEIGKNFGINFFDRMKVCYRASDTTIKSCQLQELSGLISNGEITDETIVFDNLVSNKRDFMQRWEVSIKDSWHKNFL